MPPSCFALLCCTPTHVLLHMCCSYPTRGPSLISLLSTTQQQQTSSSLYMCCWHRPLPLLLSLGGLQRLASRATHSQHCLRQAYMCVIHTGCVLWYIGGGAIVNTYIYITHTAPAHLIHTSLRGVATGHPYLRQLSVQVCQLHLTHVRDGVSEEAVCGFV